MDIWIPGLSAAVSLSSKSSYIHASFAVWSRPAAGPVTNFRSATVFFDSSSVTANSSIPLLFPLNLSLMSFSLFKTKINLFSLCICLLYKSIPQKGGVQ